MREFGLSCGLGWYLFWCFWASMGTRLFICLFRACAYQAGDGKPCQKQPTAGVGKSPQEPPPTFWEDFGTAFEGFRAVWEPKYSPKSDMWLPFLIGFCEAFAYPFLMMEQNGYLVIGGWLGIKTAGQWGVWSRSATAFNRFLLGNLAILAISYFWLRNYVAL